jgi:Dyp-type peroxidase family
MTIPERIAAFLHREQVTLALDDIQALILRSRPEPYVGTHAMLHIDDAAGGRDLLQRLVLHIPSAANWTDDMDAWTGVAFSYAGLKALGMADTSLASFPLAFQQGMAARAEQLRDFGINAPGNWEATFEPGKCHIAMTIYARDTAARDVAVAKAMRELDSSAGVTLIGTHEFGADADAKNPFGFRDSISQPRVDGSGIAALPGQERAIAAGEFILGENSETGQPLGMPVPSALGVNGSFVVLRKYLSQVGTFNDFVKASAGDNESDRHLFAAKMFGRWRSGAPLMLATDADDDGLGADPMRNNAFNFAEDPKGLLCPYSSHMRRLNPRDSSLTILTDPNIHRIIRRSSTFGPKWSPDITAADDAKGDRGIFFIFISARAFDTIEFMQQEWVNRGNFIDLADERDPIVGLHETKGQFTIPAEPARHRIQGISTFNHLKGGEYMFMPGLNALRWIANAGWQA